jgi:hypothetical protein
VWWNLGSAEVERRRLLGIAEEEAAVRARMEGRHAVRRKVALASMSLEVVALLYGLWRWRARRGQGGGRGALFKLLDLLPALAVPALATLLAAFARFRKTRKPRVHHSSVLCTYTLVLPLRF